MDRRHRVAPKQRSLSLEQIHFHERSQRNYENRQYEQLQYEQLQYEQRQYEQLQYEQRHYDQRQHEQQQYQQRQHELQLYEQYENVPYVDRQFAENLPNVLSLNRQLNQRNNSGKYCFDERLWPLLIRLNMRNSEQFESDDLKEAVYELRQQVEQHKIRKNDEWNRFIRNFGDTSFIKSEELLEALFMLQNAYKKEMFNGKESEKTKQSHIPENGQSDNNNNPGRIQKSPTPVEEPILTRSFASQPSLSLTALEQAVVRDNSKLIRTESISSCSGSETTPVPTTRRRPKRPEIHVSTIKLNEIEDEPSITVEETETVESSPTVEETFSSEDTPAVESELLEPSNTDRKTSRCESRESETSYLDVTDDGGNQHGKEVTNQNLHLFDMDFSKLIPGEALADIFEPLLNLNGNTTLTKAIRETQLLLLPHLARLHELEGQTKGYDSLRVKLAVVQEEKRQLLGLLKQRRLLKQSLSSLQTDDQTSGMSGSSSPRSVTSSERSHNASLTSINDEESPSTFRRACKSCGQQVVHPESDHVRGKNYVNETSQEIVQEEAVFADTSTMQLQCTPDDLKPASTIEKPSLYDIDTQTDDILQPVITTVGIQVTPSSTAKCCQTTATQYRSFATMAGPSVSEQGVCVSVHVCPTTIDTGCDPLAHEYKDKYIQTVCDSKDQMIGCEIERNTRSTMVGISYSKLCDSETECNIQPLSCDASTNCEVKRLCDASTECNVKAVACDVSTECKAKPLLCNASTECIIKPLVNDASTECEAKPCLFDATTECEPKPLMCSVSTECTIKPQLADASTECAAKPCLFDASTECKIKPVVCNASTECKAKDPGCDVSIECEIKPVVSNASTECEAKSSCDFACGDNDVNPPSEEPISSFDASTSTEVLRTKECAISCDFKPETVNIGVGTVQTDVPQEKVIERSLRTVGVGSYNDGRSALLSQQCGVNDILCRCEKPVVISVGVGTSQSLICDRCTNVQTRTIGVSSDKTDDVVCDRCVNRTTRSVSCGDHRIDDLLCDKCEIRGTLVATGVGDFDINTLFCDRCCNVETRTVGCETLKADLKSVSISTDIVHQQNIGVGDCSIDHISCDVCDKKLLMVEKSVGGSDDINDDLPCRKCDDKKYTSLGVETIQISDNEIGLIKQLEETPLNAERSRTFSEDDYCNEVASIMSNNGQAPCPQCGYNINGLDDDVITMREDIRVSREVTSTTMITKRSERTEETDNQDELSYAQTEKNKNDVIESCTMLSGHFNGHKRLSQSEMVQFIGAVEDLWFETAIRKRVNAAMVKSYIDLFQSQIPELLDTIVNLADDNGNTALHYGLTYKNFGVVSVLLDSNVCKVDLENKAGYTPIMLAALSGFESKTDKYIMQRLFRLGDVNKPASETGQTPLMLAVSRGNLGVVEVLMDSGVEVNLCDDDGSTALMCACEHGSIQIVKALLSNPDVDATIEDNEGSTALTIAMDAKRRDLALLIYGSMNFDARGRIKLSPSRQSLLGLGSRRSPSPVIGRM